MGYAKLPKVVTDHGLGYTSVNQLRDNYDAAQAPVIVAHGYDEPQDFDRELIYAPRTRQYGHHSDTRIPRSSLAVVLTTFPSAYGVAELRTDDQHVHHLTRISAGFFRVAMQGLSTWHAHAAAHVTSTSTVRFVLARSDFSASAPSIYVYCYELAAGDFVLTDFDFDLHVYGMA